MVLQKFFICATNGENWERKDSNLKGPEKYKEENNNVKRCMKKAKENWIEEQRIEIQENPRKNNSKRAY